MQHLLQAFLPKQYLMVLWLNKAMIDLCQDFWVFVVTLIIYKCCHRNNMVAEKHGSPRQNLSPSENLASPCPSENSSHPDSKVPPQLLKSSPQSHIFFNPLPPIPHPYCQDGVHSMVTYLPSTEFAQIFANCSPILFASKQTMTHNYGSLCTVVSITTVVSVI